MKSIRSKLFLQIGVLITVMIGLLMLVNTWLAEPYYMYTQKEQLIQYYDKIKNMEDLTSDEATSYFNKIEQSYGVEILILNHEKVLYASEGYKNDDRVSGIYSGSPSRDIGVQGPDSILQGQLPRLSIEELDVLDDGAILNKTREENFGIENLLLTNELVSSEVIELRVTLQYIQTAIETINEILVFTGGLFIIFSMVFAYLLSAGFTKPILSMNKATKKMQNLDFEVHCEVTSDDELGQLSANINHMSDVLSQTIETLHLRDEKRRQLLNNVSHELKTPLTLMQGYAVALKRSVVTAPEKTDFYTEVIIDETVKMNRLVESLLDIDQLETDKRHLNVRSFDINPFVKENVQKFESIMEEQGISYQVDYGEGVKIQCDPDLTEQVIKNLLSNAILHIDEPKTLTIRTQVGAESVRVSISNSCQPIDPDELKQLWDRFYKKDKARTREQGGHGLGLSIVKAIQDAHGQACGVDLIPGGVCFWFELIKAE